MCAKSRDPDTCLKQSIILTMHDENAATMHDGTAATVHENTTATIRTPCRYFYRSGSCRRGEQCKFSHDLQRREGGPSVLKKAKPAPQPVFRLNPASAEFKPRQPSMITVIPSSRQNTETDPEKSQWDPCGICGDVPSPFAQLLNCNHYFCVDCIKNWRTQGKQKQQKACPTCRSHSDYIYVLSEPQKDAARLLAIERHKERLKNIPCKHFEKSTKPRPPNSRKIGRRKDEPHVPFCVFGDECLYAHQIDGKEVTFDHMESVRIMKHFRKLDRCDRNLARDPRAATLHHNWLQRQQRIRDTADLLEQLAEYT